jgi:hypothetical protein
MEPVEAVANPSQVRPVGKRLLLKHGRVVTERLETNRAPSEQRVVLLREYLAELLVNVVNHLLFLLLLVAVLFKTLLDLLPQLV